MSHKLPCKVEVSKGATQYSGNLEVSNIHHENGDPVTIKNFLGLKFKSPVKPHEIRSESNPWIDLTPEISTEPLDASTFAVTAKLSVSTSQTLPSNLKIEIEIDGDLKSNSQYKDSVEVYADEIPQGFVDVECAHAPDSRLANFKQMVRLAQGDPGSKHEIILGQATLGQTTSFPALAGTYEPVADELVLQDQTVIAVPKVLPANCTVKTNDHVSIEVTYPEIHKYSALDVTIGALQSPINREELHVKVIEHDQKKVLKDFYAFSNSTTRLYRLPETGSVDIDAEMTLNNTKYAAETSKHLSNEVLHVTIDQSAIKTQKVDDRSFVALPVELEGNLQSDKKFSVRLQSEEDPSVVYIQSVQAKTGTQDFGVHVAPGNYTVHASTVIVNETVYAMNVPTKLTVDANGKPKLHLTTRRGAHLKVNGFPDFFSFGGLSDIGQSSQKDFTTARASSIFKYAGVDGNGDPGKYLDDDTATTRTIELANSVEKAIGGGHTVLPVMNSYTCNLSLGDVPTQLKNAEHHEHSFGNLILSLTLAKKYGKPACPCGYVINADFLGECQKHEYGPDRQMPVIEPLKKALKHWSISATVPDSIKDTLSGYVYAVNWLIRTVAPKVTFGWQVNLWGRPAGGSIWVYPPKKGSTDTEPAQYALDVAKYLRSLDLYTPNSANKPDFLAVDRYESDDFTNRSTLLGYCFGPAEWDRLFTFYNELSLELQVPIMAWQIPASRIPRRNEAVSDLEAEHWGTGGTYLFGDESIGSSIANINPTVLDIKVNETLERGAKTARDVFVRGEPWDLSGPKYLDFPHRGIFTVSLGGGQTTGIISLVGKTGPWTQEKVSKYMNAPIPFA